MSKLMDTVRFRALNITHGDGARLFGRPAGLPYLNAPKSWIDFFTDVGTASVGYNAPHHHAALRAAEATGLIHSPILFTAVPRDNAAELITDITGMDRVFFCNSGAEAVEAAIKLARLFHWNRWSSGPATSARTEIWTVRDGFHGRTLATLAAGDGPRYHTKGFGPLPDGFHHFSDIQEINPQAAAVLLAPVFGNNDVRPYPDGWLRALRAYTEEHGILLALDEVQTGSGRCGSATYAQQEGIQPDILTLGKGVAAGAPCGAMLARGPVADTFTPGTHFSTFGGNPLCAYFIAEMWSWLSRPATLHRVNRLGLYISESIRAMKHVKDVRQVGMLIAADVAVDTLALAERCEQAGLLLGAFRQGPGPLKITPPLNTSDEELEEGLGILRDTLKSMR